MALTQSQLAAVQASMKDPRWAKASVGPQNTRGANWDPNEKYQLIDGTWYNRFGDPVATETPAATGGGYVAPQFTLLIK